LITQEAALKVATALGGGAAWLDTDKAGASSVNEVEGELLLQLRIRQSSAAVPNVIAWIEGSDPQLKHEYVVIGAHLDHLGYQGDNMFPGADDNGSGSTAILSIARALAENPVRPKRSVLFVWFAAEEIGLVGSAYYTNNPTLPLENMVCMFNIDMVGRNEEKSGETSEENENTIHLIGSQKGDPKLHEVILAANECVNFEFEFDEEGVFGRSDQANFYNKGTSVAFLFGGFHPDYHQPSDKPEKINYNKIASAAKLYYLAIHYAAENGPFVRPAAESKPDSNNGR
jgi:Zn-dependent M28 family amino/carboxypeptidase